MLCVSGWEIQVLTNISSSDGFYIHLSVNNYNCSPLIRRCSVLYSTDGKCGFKFIIGASVAYFAEPKERNEAMFLLRLQTRAAPFC